MHAKKQKTETEFVNPGDYFRGLTARDIWDTHEARAMIDALKWICEELLMTEAVRLILCHASERNRFQRLGLETCVELWWKKYVKIAGSQNEPSRRDRFHTVVASCLGHDEGCCSLVWTGAPGKDCGDDAICAGETCNGEHMGLAVEFSGGTKTVTLHRQIGIVFRHQELAAWNPPAVGKGKITRMRADMIRDFVANADNIVQLSEDTSVYMAGAYGLAQHSCSSSAIEIEITKVISLQDANGHVAACGFQVCEVECRLAVENGRLAWNYGAEYAKQLREIGCFCEQCLLSRKWSSTGTRRTLT
jgi:hypothetical protein